MRPAATSVSTPELELHARVSVLEQQIRDQKEATVLALAAADKAIINAVVVADKAVAKVELAAEKTMLTASIDGLKEMFNQQISHQKELTAQALASADKAVTKAEGATTTRIDALNEIRGAMTDQQSGLATKNEVNLRFTALEERINNLVADARELKGRSFGGREASSDRRTEVTDNRGMIFSIITIVVAVAAFGLAVLAHLKGVS